MRPATFRSTTQRVDMNELRAKFGNQIRRLNAKFAHAEHFKRNQKVHFQQPCQYRFKTGSATAYIHTKGDFLWSLTRHLQSFCVALDIQNVPESKSWETPGGEGACFVYQPKEWEGKGGPTWFTRSAQKTARYTRGPEVMCPKSNKCVIMFIYCLYSYLRYEGQTQFMIDWVPMKCRDEKTPVRTQPLFFWKHS